MSVWLCIPSKRPPEEVNPVLKLWKERGYKVVLFCDSFADADAKGPKDLHVSGVKYKGYAHAVNLLVGHIITQNTDADWIVAAGDDTEPDPNYSAEEIALQCAVYFKDLQVRHGEPFGSGTFGVMQPTGDRWGDHADTHEFNSWTERDPLRCRLCGNPEGSPKHMVGAYIDRVCGSPWLGREFCLRINQGNGPLWPEYFHMGVDEELQAVALKYGVLWQRRDLTHHHQHWGRPKPGERLAPQERMPDFLKRANSGEEWDKYKALFAARKAAGFPGSEPL